MMRSLYSGISGLRNHQTRMDVIGNNIANVNTTGYKTSRVIFQDIFSQTSSGGMANTGPIGGTNPIQIGLGIRLSTIDVLHTRSAFARSDNAFDMMVNGDGFFIAGTMIDPMYEVGSAAYEKLFTRAGNFKLDDEGYLTTSDGRYVLGYVGEVYVTVVPPVAPATEPTYTFDIIPPDVSDPDALTRIRIRIDENSTNLIDASNPPDPLPPATIANILNADAFPGDLMGFSVGNDGSISIILNEEKMTIGQLALAMFSNPGGLEKAGGNYYRVTAPSGAAVIGPALENGSGEIMAGGLEMSNVDLATEFTDMIVTQRGFQANSRIITVSDTMLEELVNLKR